MLERFHATDRGFVKGRRPSLSGASGNEEDYW
nr:DUF2274 domain-containing protein [Novacetimonas hansenii]